MILICANARLWAQGRHSKRSAWLPLTLWPGRAVCHEIKKKLYIVQVFTIDREICVTLNPRLSTAHWRRSAVVCEFIRTSVPVIRLAAPPLITDLGVTYYKAQCSFGFSSHKINELSQWRRDTIWPYRDITLRSAASGELFRIRCL